MNYTVYKHQPLQPGMVIKDEAGQLAIILYKNQVGNSRPIYVICYMDYELSETYGAYGQWMIGDKLCSEKQFRNAYKEALRRNDIAKMGNLTRTAFDAEVLYEPLTAETLKKLKPDKWYGVDIQPQTVFGQAGFDFIGGKAG